RWDAYGSGLPPAAVVVISHDGYGSDHQDRAEATLARALLRRVLPVARHAPSTARGRIAVVARADRRSRLVRVEREPDVPYMTCPRCGLSVQLRASYLTLERCPRCIAKRGVSMPMVVS